MLYVGKGNIGDEVIGRFGVKKRRQVEVAEMIVLRFCLGI